MVENNKDRLKEITDSIDKTTPVQAVVPEAQVAPVSESPEPAPEKDEDTASVRSNQAKTVNMPPNAPEQALDEYPKCHACAAALHHVNSDVLLKKLQRPGLWRGTADRRPDTRRLTQKISARQRRGNGAVICFQTMKSI